MLLKKLFIIQTIIQSVSCTVRQILLQRTFLRRCYSDFTNFKTTQTDVKQEPSISSATASKVKLCQVSGFMTVSLRSSHLRQDSCTYLFLTKQNIGWILLSSSVFFPCNPSVVGFLHHLHHHGPGSGEDQVADGPVVQVEDVETVD